MNVKKVRFKKPYVIDGKLWLEGTVVYVTTGLNNKFTQAYDNKTGGYLFSFLGHWYDLDNKTVFEIVD